MAIQKLPNGEYYYFGHDNTTEYKIKEHPSGNKKRGRIELMASCPPELIGKKVRIKIETIQG